ncbi:TonB-dependent receptor plug domain-containing protein [Arachidicoccus terrestris]|uniref:TonB-dependent receptor plug domain-containing protein n=1 Tax=Arachidicoccus terrestris TaxID=2875539 RepID=UPI001CC612AC|nr:TonB-dependent receptor plug domain-containing protein [Arachidicoccus terrestris]UAY54583.1 TonB-dependent receptor plug domain-containing protein [Arachidicoccus terrestris]
MNLRFGKNLFRMLSVFMAGLAAGSTQFASAQRIDTLINNYGAKYPQERIHLHFDRHNYAPKDDIWFKAYLVSGIMPDQLSKTLYVDFSDETGKILAHDAYPIANGATRGQFSVPDSIRGNLIHVRAYTKWMLNFDTSFLFNQDLTVIQPASKRIKGEPPATVAKLYFFPEGGDLIAGLNTRVAFMAENQYGQPVKVAGVVKDGDGKEVATIKPEHDGMGSFHILANADATYTATWTDDKGESHTTSLPKVKPSGASIVAKPTLGSTLFAVQRTENAPENFKTLHIVATTYQQLVYMANVSLKDKSMVSGAIPTAAFPSGILQITLFDQAWKPVSERIVFVNNGEAEFHPEVGFSKLSFDKRGQNEIVVNVPDSVPANLSVSVTDATVGADSSSNLISRMLLTSQIKGRVFHPFYYFSDTTDAIRQQLDLVMLTHGWRRYNWDRLMQHEDPKITYPADTNYLTFSGKVYGASPAQIAASGTLVAITKSKQDTAGRFIMVPLERDGSFNDHNTIFFDSLQVYYKFAGKKNTMERTATINFMPDRLKSPGEVKMDINDIIKARVYDTTGLAASRRLYDQYWAATHMETNLEDVKVTTKAKSPEEKLNDKYTSGLFKSDNGYTFDVMNDIAAQGSFNIFSYLQGRVAGLQISNAQSGTPSMTWRGSSPSLFLDEMPISDASQLSNISMNDIAMVKVFRPPFMGGFGGSPGGAIAVYTRKGGDVQREKGEGMPHKTIAGYSLIKEFYVPDYLSLTQDRSKTDVRSTLYWNPLIMTTPQDHELRFKFFNNDITKSYRIILEGMNSEGQFTHIEKVIQ